MNATVTASLEGMRVVIDGPECRLEEYDFSLNEYNVVEEARWPLEAQRTTLWLSGWNRVDKFRGVNMLMSPEDPERLSVLRQLN
jgi:hypothetical protein